MVQIFFVCPAEDQDTELSVRQLIITAIYPVINGFDGVIIQKPEKSGKVRSGGISRDLLSELICTGFRQGRYPEKT